ncbi:MAG: hypothetical protein K2Y20_07400 [Sphingomonas sp.]|nr:hypothetical protein [Sphingomonas sp.]
MKDVRIRVFTDQASADDWAADMESLGYRIAPAQAADVVTFRRLNGGKQENAPIDPSESYFVVMAFDQAARTS